MTQSPCYSCFLGVEITKHDDENYLARVSQLLLHHMILPIGNHLHENLKKPLDTRKSSHKSSNTEIYLLCL